VGEAKSNLTANYRGKKRKKPQKAESLVRLKGYVT
jgi:hypothetical protein